MPVYIGPADTVEYSGRKYRPGQNIPMGQDAANALRRNGHVFEGDAPPPATEPTLIIQQPAPAAPPAPLIPMTAPSGPSQRATRETSR